jgi:hypothetical protein
MIERAPRGSGIQYPDRNPRVVRGSREPRAAHEALWAIVKQGSAEWTVGPPSLLRSYG